jgi:hypothetical protein
MTLNPDQEFNVSSIAAELGNTALQQVIQHAERACQHEKQKCALINESRITQSKARLKVLSDEREDLRATLRRTVQPPEDTKHRRGYYMTVAALLCLAGFSFVHLALSPFHLTWQVWPYSLALAIVGALLTDLVLEKYGSRHVVGIICVAALLASLTGLVLLATLRGDILILYLKSALSASNGDAISPEDAVTFYQSAASKLRVFFGLLAISMELATGLAIREARRVSREAEYIRKRLADVQQEMILLVGRIVSLTNEPDTLEHEFWSNFYRGVLCAVQRNLAHSGRIGSFLLFAALLVSSAFAQPPFVIFGLDLSKSEVTANPYGPQEHEKDIAAVAQIIATLPAGSEFRVIGITDASFSRPLILMAGKIPLDRGPLEFINRIEIARTKFATQIQTIGKSVQPKFLRTDVFGFLILAGQMFEEAHQSRRVLVVLSDMRNSSPRSDIESPHVILVASTLRTVERQHLVADLGGVNGYFLGVHAVGKDVRYWQSLRDFYSAYCKASGANLRMFSMTRDMPDFGPAK